MFQPNAGEPMSLDHPFPAAASNSAHMALAPTPVPASGPLRARRFER
jgi:hypothetical protein